MLRPGKSSLVFLLTVVFVLTALSAWANTNALVSPAAEPDEIGSPMVAGFLMLVLFVAFVAGLFLLGFGAAVGIALIALAGGLTAFGIVSSSVVIGFLQRSVTAAFRALFLQLGAVAGIPCGIGATWLFTWLSHTDWSLGMHLWIGGLYGLLSGFLVALLFNFAWSSAVAWLIKRHEKRRTPAPSGP